MKKRIISENITSTLRNMKAGEEVTFAVRKIATVSTLISRLRLEMCVEGADWERGEVDKKNGTFTIKRVA